MKDNSLEIGQVVISKAGRDAGKAFIVLDILSEEYLAVADGSLRTVEKPKKKKVKHLTITQTKFNQIKQLQNDNRLTNAEIRKLLENYGLRS